MNELFKEFQEFRKILCVCPCCGDIVRISDLKLKTQETKGKSWRDTYDKQLFELEKLKEKFDKDEKGLREIACEKGRKAAEIVFNNAISPSLKKLKYSPYDVKPVFFPIDFLVFKGMNQRNSIDELIFLSKRSGDSILNSIRKKVQTAVQDKKYDWEVARIDDSGAVIFK